MTERFHDFSISEVNGRLEVPDPPPIGSHTAFSCALLASIPAERGVFVDDKGRLVMLGLVFEPVRFGAIDAPPSEGYWIVCRRVA